MAIGDFVKATAAVGKVPNNTLKSTTVRSFEGGWNVIDTDLNLAPKYAKTLDNMERAIDGTLAVRSGTKLFSTLTTASPIINCAYFNGVIVTVQKNGDIHFVNGAGVATKQTPPAGLTWSTTLTYATFSVFNNVLTIHNGVDKPYMVHGNALKSDGTANSLYMVLKALGDPGNAFSNVNTPIGKFACAHAQYHVVAGFNSKPSVLSISLKGGYGTFLSDPAPNDAIELDLGPRVSVGSATITGLVSYRDKLLVTFDRGVLPVNLGVYTTTGSVSVHTPTDDGFIEEFGCLAHRSLVSVGDDTFFCDNLGVNSISRIAAYGTLRPVRSSQLIDPAITALIQPLSVAQIAQYVFAVYDMRHKRYMLFVPTLDGGGNPTETIGFSYTDIPVMKVSAWARLRGWNWTCACRTALQNVIFGTSNKLYSYDFDNTTKTVDFLNDASINSGNGVGVSFTWELPWADFGQRMMTKETRYLAFDTAGSGQFTCRMYVDNIIYDAVGADSPLLSTTFTAGSGGGFGASGYGTAPFGGGRHTADERMFAWTTSAKLFKFVISGTTTVPLKFVSLSIMYKPGTIRR